MAEAGWEDAVVLIAGAEADPDSGAFGTGFLVADPGRDRESGRYVLTCRHVIESIGEAADVMADGKPAEVLVRGGTVLDVALLRVTGLEDRTALRPATGLTERLEVRTRGNFRQTFANGPARIDRKTLHARILAGKDARAGAGDPQNQWMRYWELQIADRPGDWKSPYDRLEDGYSGSPLVVEQDGLPTALGMISVRRGNEYGEALDFSNLLLLPDIASALGLAEDGAQLSVPAQPIEPADERPAPDPAFRAALEQALHRELHEPRLEPLRAGLAGLLECPEKDCAGALCTEDPEMAVAYIAAAFRDCRKALSADALPPLRTGARRLMAWLLTALALQDWSQTPPDRVAADMSVRLVVGSTAAAEVLWARWSSGADAPEFRIVAVGAEERVLGARDLAHELRLPELGWEDHRAYVDAAKAALWKRLIGGAPQRFDADADERLKKAFLRDSRIYSLGIRDLPRGTQVAQHYLTMEEQDIRNPLLHPGVLDDLRRELGLPLLFIEQVPERPSLAVPDTELQDLIRQVHKLLDDIDAP